MAGARTRARGGDKKSVFLALLVVVLTAGVIVFLDEGPPEPPSEASPPEDEVLELAPMIPRGSITQASWRTGSDEEPAAETQEQPEPDSLIEAADWSESSREKKFQKSLRERMDEIHGLGVYVDRKDAEKKEDDE